MIYCEQIPTMLPTTLTFLKTQGPNDNSAFSLKRLVYQRENLHRRWPEKRLLLWEELSSVRAVRSGFQAGLRKRLDTAGQQRLGPAWSHLLATAPDNAWGMLPLLTTQGCDFNTSQEGKQQWYLCKLGMRFGTWSPTRQSPWDSHINYGSELNIPMNYVDAILRPLIGRNEQKENLSNFMKMSRPSKRRKFVPGELGDKIFSPYQTHILVTQNFP